MNYDIEETFCTFENCLLLKKKGFNVGVYHFYDGYMRDRNVPTFIEYRRRNFNAPTERKEVCSAVTQQMAMSWLRKKHNISVEISTGEVIASKSTYWAARVVFLNKIIEGPTLVGKYDTYEEAVEYAINYALNLL